MKKLLLIVGVIVIIACILSLLYASLTFSAYKSLRDGTPEHYESLHKRAITCLVIGIILAVIAIVCFVLKCKI